MINQLNANKIMMRTTFVEVNIKNCEKSLDLFAKVLAQKLGYEVGISETRLVNEQYCYNFHLSSLEIIHDWLEKAAIEKAGQDEYGKALVHFLGLGGSIHLPLSFSNVSEIAGADAATRLCACLMVLGINEIEADDKPET